MRLSDDDKKKLANLPPKAIARHSIAFFARHYLGLNVPDHQMRWYGYCTRDRHLQLSPRDHGKTTVFCHALPVWAICNIPNVRVLMVSKTSGQANKLLGTIRAELRNNPLIKQDYGELLENKSEGGAIWCTRDEVGRKLKDPTVEAVGALGAITGGHFDIIIVDDMLDDENTKTEGRMESMDNWFYGTIGQLVEPTTQMFVIGTRKHYADLYQQLIDNALWHRSIDRAIIDWPESYEYIFETDSDGNEVISDVQVTGESTVLWPEVWDIKKLLIDRQQAGSIMFDREKQNDPSGMKGQYLNIDWLQYFNWDSLPDELTYYIGVDLAISEKEHADETCIALVGYQANKRKVHLIEIRHGKWDFPTAYDKICTAYEEWAGAGMRAVEVLIENNVYQAAMAQHIADSTWIPAVGVLTVKDKITKMLAIAPHFENGSVLLRKTEMLGIPEFRQQWAQFPFAEHDDMLDAVAIAITRLALGSISTVGLIDSDSPLEVPRQDDDYDYVFCECGEEYGMISGKMPIKNGICDKCGKKIQVMPVNLQAVTA